jgi:tRNA dimethylallyltransferase
MRGASPAELVVICGPTATGKTTAAIRLCQRVGGEVISADAVQIYRHLDIGSAKPSAAEQAAARHHLIDVLEPTERYSAARFIQDADRAVEQIRARGKVPVVAGGCGLYIRALLYGLMPAPPADAALRQALEAEEISSGRGTLHRRLALVDPRSAERIHPADRVRLVRALEVFELTGRTMSEHQEDHSFAAPRYPARIWGIDPGPPVVRERIDARVSRMMEQGFLEEVESLLARGIPRDCPGLSAPGYRELVSVLEGALAWDEAVERIRRAHRLYARRQRTWFRKTRGLRWFPDARALPLEEVG